MSVWYCRMQHGLTEQHHQDMTGSNFYQLGAGLQMQSSRDMSQIQTRMRAQTQSRTKLAHQVLHPTAGLLRQPLTC